MRRRRPPPTTTSTPAPPLGLQRPAPPTPASRTTPTPVTQRPNRHARTAFKRLELVSATCGPPPTTTRRSSSPVVAQAMPVHMLKGGRLPSVTTRSQTTALTLVCADRAVIAEIKRKQGAVVNLSPPQPTGRRSH
jgi:hypothetical protein